MYMKMDVDDTDRGKLKFSETTLFHCHFDNHETDLDSPGIEL